MSYKTVRQQCQELLAAKRYDELQALLSAEREKQSIELQQILPYIPRYLPRFLVAGYARLPGPCLAALAKNRPSLLREEA